jgi:hypothetical protein
MNEQARLLLSAYRPSGSDANDPAFAEALTEAERDPQLRAWLAESQRFDHAIAHHVRSLPVPPDLRAAILAGAKASQPRPARRTVPRWVAAAAVLMLLGAAGLLVYSLRSRLADWQTQSLAAIEAVEDGAVKLDVENTWPAPLLEYLADRSAPRPAELPPSLANRPTLGCKTIVADGRVVSVICFRVDARGAAHLFSTARKGLRFPPPERHPILQRRKNWNVASWSQGSQSHMLASKVEREQFRELVPTLASHSHADEPAPFALIDESPVAQ